MRWRTVLVIVALGFAAAALTVGGHAWWYVHTPRDVRAPPARVDIPEGSRLRTIVDRLERAGVDAGGLRFELMARLTGRAESVRAGTYQFDGPMTPPQLLDKLVRGDVVLFEVRIVEGWTFRQVRAAIARAGFMQQDSAAMTIPDLLKAIDAEHAHPEGLFFPDTYRVANGASDLSLLKRAHQAMQRALAAEWAGRSASVPYSDPYQALIMASIVEKETGRAEERGLIAGVLVNRLRIGMPLQADPTIIYGLGNTFDGNLKRVHLQTDGPYNTYLRRGLPPTPIAMPGAASLRAALQPDQTDALYYVSRGDGSSQFSRTLREHNRAVDRYQRAPARR